LPFNRRQFNSCFLGFVSSEVLVSGIKRASVSEGMKSMSNNPSVLIVGSGLAGLVAGNILAGAGIACLIVERQSREHIEQRSRVGFLAQNSVRVLKAHGLASGLLARGQQHDTCTFRGEFGQFELQYSLLGRGEIHTVYPEHFLVRDLIGEFLKRGGRIRFDTEVRGIDAQHAEIGSDGAQLSARFVIGCDGQHGVTRRAVPARRYHRDHGVTCLALLVDAPSVAPVIYAVHPHGFAGQMARTNAVTRYYLQVSGSDAMQWADDRIWSELSSRMRVDEYGPLAHGPIIDRRIVSMTSTVLDPIQCDRLFLAGDAASLISPSAAKGANLAIMAAETLADALISAIRDDNDALLQRYSANCLARIWRAQDFSQWMIDLLYAPRGNTDTSYLHALQLARLENLRDSRAFQDFFAENYLGV
jgi:p-hydroxybenzoate 3-monooxygenase